MENTRFIEVNRIISDRQTKLNTSVQLESVNIDLIESFRGWHKGKNDVNIEGKMTLIILKDREKDLDDNGEVKNRDDVKARTMLILESYHDFLNRINGRVSISRLATNEASNDTKRK
jgi:hypothetical protein